MIRLIKTHDKDNKFDITDVGIKEKKMNKTTTKQFYNYYEFVNFLEKHKERIINYWSSSGDLGFAGEIMYTPKRRRK